VRPGAFRFSSLQSLSFSLNLVFFSLQFLSKFYSFFISILTHLSTSISFPLEFSFPLPVNYPSCRTFRIKFAFLFLLIFFFPSSLCFTVVQFQANCSSQESVIKYHTVTLLQNTFFFFSFFIFLLYLTPLIPFFVSLPPKFPFSSVYISRFYNCVSYSHSHTLLRSSTHIYTHHYCNFASYPEVLYSFLGPRIGLLVVKSVIILVSFSRPVL